MFRSILCAAIVAAATMTADAHQLPDGFIVYKVGGGADCPYHTIQDAIDAAAGHAGIDLVWIATDQTYTDQHVVVTDQDVIIEGGFTDCEDIDPALDQTTVNGTSGHSVFEIEGTSNVTIDNLEITGAVMDADHSGGGIYFGGQGSLTLYATWVFNNQAGYGGGIDVSPSGPTTLTLQASTVSGNTALVSGGGVRIEGPTVLNATHAPGEFNIYIAQNAALGQGNTGYGGGVEVLGPAVANISSVVDLNSAPYGGGVAALATDQGSALVNLFTTDPGDPLSVYGNTATSTGGGIFLKPHAASSHDAKLCAQDFRIDGNVAVNGAAIYADADDGLGSIAFLNSACDSPPGAIACPVGGDCNHLFGNVAQDPSGGVVLIQSDGAFSANRFVARANQGGALVYFVADTVNDNGGNYAHLHDCLLTGNVVGGNLVFALGGAGGTQLVVDTCTIADNQMSDLYYVIGADTNFAEVTNSIIYQPNQPSVAFLGPAGDFTGGYILTNDTIPLTGYEGIVDGVPLFVDPANGDYHLQRTSPGVDMAPALDGVDLDGNPRTLDLFDVPNAWGPMDVGAYEIQTQAQGACSAADTIFCTGFDPP